MGRFRVSFWRLDNGRQKGCYNTSRKRERAIALRARRSASGQAWAGGSAWADQAAAREAVSAADFREAAVLAEASREAAADRVDSAVEDSVAAMAALADLCRADIIIMEATAIFSAASSSVRF